MTRVRPTSRTITVSSRSLVAIDQAARSLGIHLDLSDLAPQFDAADPSAEIPLSQQIAYCHALLSRPRETIGMDLAVQLPLESTGLWGFLLRSSATFGEMLARARRYQRIVNVYPEFGLEDKGADVLMVCDHPDPSPFGPREQVVCMLLFHWIVWGRQLTGHDLPASYAAFRWAGPRDRTPFEAFLQCPVFFGRARDVVAFPRHYLDLPCKDSAPELSGAFEAYAAAMVSRLDDQESFISKVEKAIDDGLLKGHADEERVATSLGVTPRTLHRRLAAEGTSFRMLKRERVESRAKEFLRSGTLPLAEISYLLGFSEPSSFHRAFRRWTGQTPDQWRKSLA